MAKKSNGGAGRKSAAGHIPPMKPDAGPVSVNPDNSKKKESPLLGAIRRQASRKAAARSSAA